MKSKSDGAFASSDSGIFTSSNAGWIPWVVSAVPTFERYYSVHYVMFSRARPAMSTTWPW
jgi:hypothetical protein